MTLQIQSTSKFFLPSSSPYEGCSCLIQINSELEKYETVVKKPRHFILTYLLFYVNRWIHPPTPPERGIIYCEKIWRKLVKCVIISTGLIKFNKNILANIMQNIKMKKVAIIDDDLLLLDMYSGAFSRASYEVIKAQEGKEGYKKILENHPDIVFTDIVMPDHDGFYLIEKVRKHEELSKMPLIALSNLDSKDDVEEAMRLGADGYVIKSSITPSKLIEKTAEILNNLK